MISGLRTCPAPLRWRLVSAAASRPSLLPVSFASRPTLSWRLPTTLSSLRAFYQTGRNTQYAAAAAVEVQETERYDDASVAPATTFMQLAERGLVDKAIIRTLTKTMGLETMTEVQSLTINEALKGKDVLAQAKTGTGKTIGFLLPVLQRILNDDPSLISARRRAPRFGERASDIRAIVVSPTRELAEQIAEEARKLTQGTGVIVQTAVGGTQKSFHLRQMQREGCQILVGTPGRLKDILSDRQTGVDAPKLSAFVLDEADRLLDQGFWPEIQAIQELLPSRKEKDRQSLMFSATVPKEVVQLVRTVMKPDLHYVRTVQENEEPTHERVKQMLVTVPGLENLLPSVFELCQRELTASEDQPTNRRPFKAIVYYNATAETTLAASIFFNIRRNRDASQDTNLASTRIFVIHSRLTQHQRTAAADQFRHATSGILMSTDVTARGMDFPGVTHIIQVGIPPERDTYIHRLGRTARAGQEGEGWLILAEATLREARTRLGKLPLEVDTSLEASHVDFSRAVAGAKPEGMTKAAQAAFDTVHAAALKVEPEEFEKTFLALLGTFQWFRNKEWMVTAMNRLSKIQWGMDTPPGIGRQLAGKLGLLGVPGLNIGGGTRAAFGTAGPRRKFGDDAVRGERRSGGSFGRVTRSGGFGDESRDGDRRASGFSGDRRSGGVGDDKRSYNNDRRDDYRKPGGFDNDKKDRFPSGNRRDNDRKPGGFGDDRRGGGGFSGDSRPSRSFGDRAGRGTRGGERDFPSERTSGRGRGRDR